MDRHEEEGSVKLDSGYLGQGLRVSERSQSRVGKPEGWHVCRKILRGCRCKGGPPPLQLPEPQREKSVRIPNAHP